ncbi:MAG: universal stress protein, UspA family [Flavobacteriaceae bacterium]|nr:universal stress protein, UspA family [Flavobacteriaceae bacterium]
MNILLPTDFSENSKNAIRYALDFFKGHSCTFYFLNVQKAHEYVTGDILSASPKSSVYDAIMADNKAALTDFMKAFEKAYANQEFTFQAKVDFDNFVDAINQAVSLYDIDLIVMGTNGATNANEVLFGSNTLTVIREVDCPLLAIPEAISFQPVKSVLFSLHHGDDLQKEVMEPLFRLLKLHGSPHVQVLDIDDDAIANPTEEEDHNIATVFSGTDHSFHALTGIPTAVAIDAFVQLFHPGLHAMFVVRESFLERFVFGSEISQVSYETRVPLVVLHRH